LDKNDRNLEDIVNKLFQGRLTEETKIHLEEYKNYISIHNYSSDSSSQSDDGAGLDNQPNKDFKPKATVITFQKNQMKGLTDKTKLLEVVDDVVMTPSNSDSEQEKD
jgi:hypothetical protein